MSNKLSLPRILLCLALLAVISLPTMGFAAQHECDHLAGSREFSS